MHIEACAGLTAGLKEPDKGTEMGHGVLECGSAEALSNLAHETFDISCAQRIQAGWGRWTPMFGQPDGWDKL